MVTVRCVDSSVSGNKDWRTAEKFWDLERDIIGLSNQTLVDCNDWDGFKPRGHLYPDYQFRIYQDVATGYFVVTDETGWNGFEETQDSLVDWFGTYKEARQERARLMNQ